MNIYGGKGYKSIFEGEKKEHNSISCTIYNVLSTYLITYNSSENGKKTSIIVIKNKNSKKVI